MREREKPWRKSDPKREAYERDMRLTHICRMLDSKADKRLVAATHRHEDECIVTIAIRDLAVFEMTMPWSKFDAWDIMELIDKHGGDIGDDE